MNHLLFFVILLFLSYSTSSKANDGQTDSLFNEAYKLLIINPDSAFNKIASFEQKIESYTADERRQFYHQAALFYRKAGQFGKESSHLEKQIALLPPNSDTLYAILLKNAAALINIGAFDKAMTTYETCREYYLENTNKSKLGEVYNGIGTVTGIQGDIERSIENFLIAIEITSEFGTDFQLLIVLSNIANAYIEIDEINKAFETRQKIYNLALKTEDKFEIHLAEQDLGATYNLLGQSDSALLYLNSAKQFFEAEYNPQMLSVIYNDLGDSYSNLEDYDQSKFYYLKSINNSKEKGYIFPLPSVLSDYGRVLYRTGDFTEGISVCQEAFPLALALGYPKIEASVCECLYLNFKGNEQFDSALFYYEKHLTLIDSISNVRLQKKMLKEELKASHSKEKEGIIAEANTELEKVASLRNLWIFGFLVLLCVLVVLFMVFRQKKKATQIIKDEKEYLDNLLHNLVHEFRTPLTLIKGPAEELLKKNNGDKLVKLIDKNSDHILNLVNQVLDFSKIKAGRLEVMNAPTSLSVFYENTVTLFRSLAAEKHIELVDETTNTNQTINIDSDKLFKITSNLLTNAIKYSDDNGVVTIKSDLQGDMLLVSVADNGIGISDENLEKIFEKFYQVDATITRKGEGTGLGLAFVKELVHLMDGTISLTSTLGEGTTVTVKLPIKIVENEANTVPSRVIVSEDVNEEEFKNQENEENLRKILIIEDNNDLQDFLGQILQEEGYEVHKAMDGKEGILVAEELIPDLVISDVMMPKMDGYQVVEHLKTNFATDHIPIIILTAKASFDSVIDGLGAGADDYLSKPFKSNELLLRIANQINRQEKLQEKILAAMSEKGAEKITKHDLIVKIETIIIEDLGRHISVEELAEYCALSRSQLHRKIKFICGLSTTALLTKIRLDMALEDLQKTELSISEIAYKYGYSDPAHFSKLFKKEYNTTPTESRK